MRLVDLPKREIEVEVLPGVKWRFRPATVREMHDMRTQPDVLPGRFGFAREIDGEWWVPSEME